MAFKEEFKSWLVEYMVTPESMDLTDMIAEAADVIHLRHKAQDIKSIYKQAYEDAVPVVARIYSTIYDYAVKNTEGNK